MPVQHIIDSSRSRLGEAYGYVADFVRHKMLWLSGITHGDNNVQEIRVLPLADFKKEIELALASFVEHKREEYKTISQQASVVDVFEHTSKILLKGGKRARPYIAYLAAATYQSLVGRSQNLSTMRFAGIEMFHVFALIHDDIIDKATTRHGVQTLHEQQKDALLLRKSELRALPHDAIAAYGGAQAILAGDLVFSWAFEALFGKYTEQSKNMHQLKNLFHRMIDEVVIGQMIDVSISTKTEVNEAELEEKNNLKTARYSFVMPMKIGAEIARMSDVHKKQSDEQNVSDVDVQLDLFFEKLGTVLGLAFQMQDDLLDIIGDEKKTGKPTMLDVESGQHTYITNYVRKHGSSRDIEKLNRCFGNSISDTDRHDLKIIFEQSGALNKVKDMVSTYIEEARNIVRMSTFDEEIKKQWNTLIDIVDGRKQ